MRLQLISDLHLERQTDFTSTAVPGVDLLVLAGDVGSYQAGSRLVTDDFGLGRFSPLRPDAAWSRVLYVPGNHEFDGLEYTPTYDRLRRTCEELGIEWLDREVIVIDGVRFVGTTLWSDFDALAVGLPTLTQQLAARDKAFRAANYYLRKYSTLRNGQPMLAEDLRALALDCQDWLRRTLETPFDGKTAVVSHFAPSLRSADPRYGLTPGTAGFCNALDAMFPLADVWMHGHLHCLNDYVVETPQPERGEGAVHRCRVVANPLGYEKKGEQEDFRPELVIEI
ncbi:metallophosphoesterase [Roseateles amylovorans]|uniref:Metallophosphoesterase n=1 Tax=Roseateles amylovorans TaxID=2978473 RepID=A0ABY6B310_9BURK|nr:metallophosphoesterase [Roseateles amylovorans]UXH78606.1 metallophosphoesterase [Roseateles amylovorans]